MRRFRLVGLVLALAGCRASQAAAFSGPDDGGAESSEVRNTAEARGKLEALLSDPAQDEDGTLRAALCIQAAIEEGPAVAPLLVEILDGRFSRQPVVVSRKAITALGMSRSPEGAKVLVRAPFMIPDHPSTTSVAERAKVALAAIGEPALDAVLAAIDHRDPHLDEAVQANGVPWPHVEAWSAMAIGAIGSRKGVPALLERIEGERCGERLGERPRDNGVAAAIAHALGLIGDERAVPALCACLARPMIPQVDFPILEAMGRMGGPAATSCLLRVVREGESARESIEADEFLHELRWEAARLAILSGSAKDVPAIRTAITANRVRLVRRKSEQWNPGLELLERCQASRKCYETALSDDENGWFVREVSAYRLSRLADGDLAASLALSRAFSVPEPDARASMALLAPRVARGQACPECIAELEAVHERERGTMPATMQLPVLLARAAIARFGGVPSALIE